MQLQEEVGAVLLVIQILLTGKRKAEPTLLEKIPKVGRAPKTFLEFISHTCAETQDSENFQSL